MSGAGLAVGAAAGAPPVTYATLPESSEVINRLQRVGQSFNGTIIMTRGSSPTARVVSPFPVRSSAKIPSRRVRTDAKSRRPVRFQRRRRG